MGLLNIFSQLAPTVLSAIGIGQSNKANREAARERERDRKLQLDTLQNQIQWRMADAQKAGVHPVAALGMSPSGYVPVGSAGTEALDFAGLGQDISRAIHAGQTERERRAAAGRASIEATQAQEVHLLSVERMGLENELLRSQIGRYNSAQLGPPMPDAAPGDVDVLPDQVTVGSPGAPQRSPGMLTDYSFGHASTSNDGGSRYTLTPSADMKQRIEDTPQEWGWQIRNGIVPSDSIFRDLHAQHPPRDGYEWRFDPFTQQFWQRPLNGRRRHY